MKEKIIYLLLGALVGGVVAIVVSVSLASPAIPNPGHGTSQIEGDANLNMNNYKIINVATPTADTDVTTKGYTDTEVASLSLTCHTVYNTQNTEIVEVACDYGILTGGGCGTHAFALRYSVPQMAKNGWLCYREAGSSYLDAYAVCCVLE